MKQTPSFGEILRERRSLLGLTQAELARRAGCAPITVRKMEGDGLRPSVQLAELLALALQIPEGEQTSFVRLARQEKPITPIPRPTPSAAEIGLEDLTGRAVKGFQLAELIGSGGFGVVYRAVQPSVQRDVAVKIILPRFANHPTFIRRFEAEAHLVARLEHPHIVPLYDYWREPNAAYLIMRLLRAGSLDKLLQQGPLELSLFRQIVFQVGQALAVAHANNVVHRDIKPANILLDDAQNAYLGDFGIAKMLDLASDDALTDDGALIGSPAYISPEQIQNEPIRPSSDIYCFGLLLFEMLTGRKAFPGPTPLAYLQQHLNEPVPSLISINPSLPPALEEMINRTTAKDPRDRFPHMSDLLTRLEMVLAPSVLELGLPLADIDAALLPLTTQEIAALENPYRGLQAFSESDADNYFGRETLVQELLSKLSNGSDLERFLAVVGPSGSGKSSLVKAGLLPALRRGGLPGSDEWFIVDMTPGDQPWQELEAAMLRVAVDPPDSLLTHLQEGPRGLLRAVQRCLPDDGEMELVLLIDQFEELFTLVADEAVREAFLQSLVTAVLDPQSRVRIVITLRADFTDRPLQYVDFGELMEQRLALVLPLTPDELTQAITRPVEKLGMAMSPELVSTIIQDVGNQPGMLPLLQYALTELFEQRQGRTLTLENYKQTGGVAGALARRADEIFTHLDAAGQEATRQLFLRLITLGEGSEDTRRRVLLAELESMPVMSLRDRFAHSNQLSVNGKRRVEHRLRNTDYGSPITDYGKYRLLTFDRDPVTRGPTVEVAHEALLREWPRLRNWLRDGREDVRRQRLLAQAAAQWQQNSQDDSYLLRGSRLTAFEAWAEATTVALTAEEHHFLQTSITARDERHATEEARRQRELETAKQLAKEQTRRAEEQAQAARSLRKRALFLTGALILAAILAILATSFANSSSNNAELAASREAEALTNLNLAATNESNAITNASLAATREAEAEIERAAAETEASFRATAEAVAEQQLVLAQESERNALEAYSLSLAANARQVFDEGERELGLLLALAANGIDNPPLTSWQTLVNIAYAPGARQQIDYGQTLYELSVSHDGRFVAAGALDGTVVVWELESGEIIKELVGHEREAHSVVFSPDDRFVLSGSVDRSAILWDFATGEIVHRLEIDTGIVGGAAFTPDGKQALLGMNNASDFSELILWDLATGEVISRFGADEEGNQQGIQSLAVSPDGQIALVGAGSNSLNNQHPLVLWNIETQEVIRYVGDSVDWVNGVAISPDGKFGLAAYSSASHIGYYNLETGELIHQLDGHTGDAVAVAFSPNGRTALSSGLEGSIVWWDLATGTVLEKFYGHSDSIFGLTFINDGQAASTSLDGTILIWDLTSKWQLNQWAAEHQGNLLGATSLAISPNGRYALSGTGGSKFSLFINQNAPFPGANGLILWDYGSGELLDQFYGHDLGINDIAFTPDSRWALTASTDSTLILWNLSSGNQLKRLTAHSSSVNAVDISSDGNYALSASVDNQVIYWDLQTGKVLQRMVGHFNGSGINDVAFLPGDHLAVSAAWDGSIIIWDLATGQQIKRLTALTGNISFLSGGASALSVSNNGLQLLVANRSHIYLWDLEAGLSINEFVGHPANVTSVEMNPSQQAFASIDPEGGIYMWDLSTGKIIRHFPTKGILVAISPDGQTALSASVDGSIIKWQLAEPSPAELIDWLPRNRLLRELTCLERETYRILPLCEGEIAQTTTADLLRIVQETTTLIQTGSDPDPSPQVAAPLDLLPPEYPEYEAVVGENRGSLVRDQFDIWRYEGHAGEVLNLHMVADNPIQENIGSVFDWYDAGLLDPLLFIIAPDGSLLGRGDDSLTADGSILSDAQINGVVLPQDGVYQIQARSYLDGFEGAYSLFIESAESLIIDPLVLAEYEGHYLEGPWQFDVFVTVEEGKLQLYTEQFGQLFDLVPTSETEFVDRDGSIIVFTRDEAGRVNGYDIWVSLVHSVGGHWYRAEKLDD
ncbi:MAG: protein kinase [Anaerolineaceae bacterium]|nr:protein kinase [Anaerolineaceae bacterium]